MVVQSWNYALTTNGHVDDWTSMNEVLIMSKLGSSFNKFGCVV